MSKNHEIIETDFLIIGSGLAGLYSAYKAAEHGTVALVTKSDIELSSSYWAQGGIAAAIDSADATEFHLRDTLTAGREICKESVVKILVEEGKEIVEEIIQLGMPFDRKSGKIELGMEGGHSKRRILHADGDATGSALVNFTAELVKNKSNIKLYTQIHIFQLISDGESCWGAAGFNWKNKSTIRFDARVTVLATGGASGIYERTTNPYISTGDGVMLGYNAGTEIADMEFIQFHPTAFYSPSGQTFLITEAIRGEGAYLLNNDFQRFMTPIHPLKELAPRDIVSKSIFNEMKKEKKENVFLDLRHLDAGRIRKRFSHITEELSKFDINITKDLIPVAPAAHYSIGGIRTGPNGETNVKNLFACGEVSCTGIHGANRLASNSLLECLVFGRRVINAASVKRDTKFKKMKIEYEFFQDNSLKLTYNTKKNIIAEILMDHIGINRNAESIKQAIILINETIPDMECSKNEYFSHRSACLKNLSLIIAESALRREESRGTHQRTDFNKTLKKFQGHFVFSKKNKPVFLNKNQY